MTGNFNIHLDDILSPKIMVYLDIIHALGLTQHVKIWTHKDSNLLDLVNAEEASQYTNHARICNLS